MTRDFESFVACRDSRGKLLKLAVIGISIQHSTCSLFYPGYAGPFVRLRHQVQDEEDFLLQSCSTHNRPGSTHRDTAAASRCDRRRDVIVIHGSAAAGLRAVARTRHSTCLVAHEGSLAGYGRCGAEAFPAEFKTEEAIRRGGDGRQPGFGRGHAKFKRHGVVGRYELHGSGVARLEVASDMIEVAGGLRKKRGFCRRRRRQTR